MDLESAIWTEKYRPKRLAEMVGQEHAVKRLEAFVKSNSLPHCLFAGPAGVGKSTASICIAHELYGTNWRKNFLELNASDERGIDTVRVKVKDFARTLGFEAKYKIIFLDEADSLTKDAQHALRRTMERYSSTARFILSANYSSKIIAPIQSRTAIFRFMPLKESEIVSFLKFIVEKEKLQTDEAAYKSIVYMSEGDMRKAVNILQSAAVFDGKITEETVLSVTSRADPHFVKNMMTEAINGKFTEARSHLASLFSERGVAAEDVIKEIHNQLFDIEIDDKKKVQLLDRIGECEFRITEGANAKIQLESLLAYMAFVGKK
ncbi:MAG: replication factor C small subunit [Candidatus Aenigmatarchaeota archaeon]